MATTPSASSRFSAAVRPSRRLDRWCLRRLRAALGEPPLEIVLWDGKRLPPARGDVSGRLRIRDPGVVSALLRNPELAFGDAYAEGRIEVEGDLVRMLESAFRASARSSWIVRGLRRVLALRLRRNSSRRSRDHIHHHYDIGNDFYELWLDREMQYTCAYFPTPEASLEEAQLAKMDHVCRKLRLRPGERVVEAGCGWGGLALHMAERYGVQVRAFNISSEQIRYAREWAKRRGLGSRVEFVEDDYRNIRGRYDVFVSVGMLEHVGRRDYPTLGAVIDRCLDENGRGLVHSIGRARPQPINVWIERRIFPGGYIPSLREMMLVFEPHDLAVLDVENLRLHYARTLEHWLERFEKATDRIEKRFDPRFVRMWRLYLASSIAAFRTGSCHLFQVVFARSACNAIPWTRADLYRAVGPSEGEARWSASTS